MPQEIINLENVWKIYGEGESKVEALRGINLNVKNGEFVAILGPSGSGKSTGMNMIGCLDIPTRGRILLNGIDILHLTESELAEIRGKKIGFVFQQFNLIPNLTALENVMLPMIFQNYSSDIRIKKADEILNAVGLENRKDHLPSELSGGEQQRVAIARALANNPEIILCDEPTGNLDTKTGEKVIDFLLKLNKNGKTIIVITHNEELALKASRIVKLKDGKIENEK